MARASLNRADAKFSLCQVLAPKLIYPCIATNLSEEQCYNIIKPVLVSALLAMGINQHFPWAVVHDPRSHQDLGIPNLFTDQLCAHIMILLRFSSQPHDPTGHLIQVKAEAFQLDAGLACKISLMPIGIYKYMTTSWFTKTWYHCRLLQIEITMEVKDFVLPQQGNVEIMWILLKHSLQEHKLAIMNHCCMFLNANYLSNIVFKTLYCMEYSVVLETILDRDIIFYDSILIRMMQM